MSKVEEFKKALIAEIQSEIDTSTQWIDSKVKAFWADLEDDIRDQAAMLDIDDVRACQADISALKGLIELIEDIASRAEFCE